MLLRMQHLDFGAEELAAARRVLAAASAMRQIEKVAFAATQCLYDRPRAASSSPTASPTALTRPV